MSSHYIYVSCSSEDCETTEMIYTGSITTDQFDDDWEGETVYARCLDCKQGETA